MNQDNYRRAFDSIPFSADFRQRTEAMLIQARMQAEKEKNTMHIRKTGKAGILIAAAIAALTLSVSAVCLLLSPAQVAERMEDPLLAAAFAGDGAVVIAETAEVGDYTVTLEGMVSGDGLSAYPAEYNGDIINDRTYAVFRIARTDGTPLEPGEQPEGLSFSPLVAGYHVSAVNGWTLGATCQSFVEDGAAYYLFDTRNLEMFADHTVYFAVYNGGVPSAGQFSMAADGSISLAEGVEGALFILPLDSSLADPAAAEEFVRGTGLEFYTGSGR